MSPLLALLNASLPINRPTKTWLYLPQREKERELLLGRLLACVSWRGRGEVNDLSTYSYSKGDSKVAFSYSDSGLQRKSHLCIPRKGILRGLSPNFHIHVSVSDLYIPRIGPHIFLQQNRQTDRGKKNRSQTYECGYWDWISLLGIFVTNFQYCVFAVCHQ